VLIPTFELLSLVYGLVSDNIVDIHTKLLQSQPLQSRLQIINVRHTHRLNKYLLMMLFYFLFSSGADGNVEESMKIMAEVEELKANKRKAEVSIIFLPQRHVFCNQNPFSIFLRNFSSF